MKTGLVAMGIGAGVLALLGLVLTLFPGPSATFGWFAYQPMGDFGFVGGMPFVPTTRLWGLGLIAVALVIGAFVAGWAVGTAHASRVRR
ncbi:hypothetical protein ABIQ69_17185 [Agromyces sp. G08B096]|uniref:Uncharacterized protein n=1 Tax=Agromyces sp. G08B096 TaxID=3156399 RepID=A0AAU7W7B0_9MICO